MGTRNWDTAAQHHPIYSARDILNRVSSQTLKKMGIGYESFFEDGEETVVCIHSLFSSSIEWKSTALHRNHDNIDTRFHVVLTSLKPHEISNLDYCVSELARLIEKRGKNGKVYVVGISIGARIAVSLAMSHPEIVSSLVVSGHVQFSPSLTDRPNTWPAGSNQIRADISLETALPKCSTLLHEAFHLIFGAGPSPGMLEGSSEFCRFISITQPFPFTSICMLYLHMRYLLLCDGRLIIMVCFIDTLAQCTQRSKSKAVLRRNPESYVFFISSMYYLFGTAPAIPVNWDFTNRPNSAAQP
jgi:pimeloyl-ACP methyl ester carboxylesterase